MRENSLLHEQIQCNLLLRKTPFQFDFCEIMLTDNLYERMNER